MGRIDPEWTATVSNDCYYVQFNVAGAQYRISTQELATWGTEVGNAVIEGHATEDFFLLRLRPEPDNRHDRNAIAVDLRWPGRKQLFRGRKPTVYRHCGYVPAELAEVIHASGLLVGGGLLLLLDHIWYGDDNPAAFRVAVDLLADADGWELLHAEVTKSAAWSSVTGIGLISAGGGRTFRLTRGRKPKNLYPKVVA